MQIPGARDIPGARSSRRACSHFKRSPLVFAIPGGRMNSTSGGLRPTVGLCAEMNSASRGLRPTVGLRRPGGGFASAEADAWRASALRGRFQSAQKPSANGRPAPTGRGFCVGGGRRLARKRLEGPISIGTKAFGQRSACADREGVLRRRRPTPGAERLERPISIGTKAFGRRSACAPNEFGLGPSADGRPVPTEKRFASAEADAWRASALRGRFQSAQKPSADGRPVPTEKRSLRRRRPTPGAQAP
jgi:hypothetical protein